MEDQDWADQARCRGVDPELFFARGLHEARPALKVCARCPVKDQCLTYAISHDIDHGVWGGLTERQRRAFARRSALARVS
ncbi:MAG: WhiB family transcriptional regulator [Nitriliruptor sp.]|uniref:WhiB family transcriptional regulator n=1 Tax=Nitriliruptor sp. TaxID=2448056 RepID=UPI0034A0653E